MVTNRMTTSLYTEGQLLDIFKSLLPDVQVTVLDLRNPSSNFVCSMYQSFLVELGVNKNALLQVQGKQTNLITYNEMYTSIVPFINLYRAVDYFTRCLGIPDFSLSDLLNPNPKRTFYFLNILMHFLLYCDERVSDQSDHLNEIHELKFKKEELLREVEKIKNQINNRATERVKREEIKEQLNKVLEEKRIEFTELFKKRNKSEKFLAEAKLVIAEDEKKAHKFVNEEIMLKDEIAQLKNMVVKSPQKVKDDFDRLTEKLNKAVKKSEEMQSQLEQKKKIIIFLSEEHKSQELRLEELREIVELHNNIVGNKKMEESFLKKIDKLADRKEEISQAKILVNQKLSNLTKMVVDLSESRTRETVANNETLQTLSRKLEEEKSKVSAMQEKSREIQKSLKESDIIQEEFKNRFEVTTNSIYNCFADIQQRENECKKYYTNLLDELRNP